MLRLLLILILCFSGVGTRADDTLIPPLKAIEQFGSISIDDGSSYYTLTEDLAHLSRDLLA